MGQKAKGPLGTEWASFQNLSAISGFRGRPSARFRPKPKSEPIIGAGRVDRHESISMAQNPEECLDAVAK